MPLARSTRIEPTCQRRTTGALEQFSERAGVIDGRWDDEFPLVVFQTGSGTQTNMNANEVIANRAIPLSGDVIGSKKPIHPNDDVNHSQSPNDTFPTAMHIVTVEAFEHKLVPAVFNLRQVLDGKSTRYGNAVMLGRTNSGCDTHSRPSDFRLDSALDEAVDSIRQSLPGIYSLAVGGTGVGTGLNATLALVKHSSRWIAAETGQPFVLAPNKFAALSAHDGMVGVSGALHTLAER